MLENLHASITFLFAFVCFGINCLATMKLYLLH
jgi:hypothetical protein